MMKMVRSALNVRFAIGICLLLLLGASLEAQEATPSPSADALTDTIWFDADQNSLLPVDVTPREDDSLNRDSRWLPKAKRVRVPDSSNTAGAAAATGGGGGWFGTGLTLGNILGWLIIFATIASVVAGIAYLLSKSDFDFAPRPGSRAAKRLDTPDEQTRERMKHLPAELRRTDVNLRSEAERLMGTQAFDQAIILLFAHQLLLLDRAGLLRLNRGKTNRRYIRETRSTDRDAAEWLQATVNAFERSYFGRHSIDGAEFHELWADNQKLEQAVQRRSEVAA